MSEINKSLDKFYILNEDDKIKNKPEFINFKCYERHGIELFRVKKVYKSLFKEEIITNIQQVLKAKEFVSFTYIEPIKIKDDLKEGDEVIVFRFYDFDFAKITKNDWNELQAETNYSVFALEFGKDDRNCWVAACEINKKCFELDIIK